MNALAICGIALLCYAALMIIGKDQPAIGALIALGGTICLLAPAVLALRLPFSHIQELIEKYDFIGAEQLFKAFGIGFCCDFTSHICKDAGYHSLAHALSFCCKISILLLCLPLWEEIFSFIGGLIP